MMNQLEIFKLYIQGDFNNQDQINRQKEEGNLTHPYAEHVNRIVDDKIENLPADLNGFFVLEESYYTNVETGRQNPLPHLFFFTEDEQGRVKLISYETPADYPRKEFTNSNPNLKLDYKTLKVSEKFNPMTYDYIDGTFYGKSISQFNADTIFTLEEWIKDGVLLVTEILEKKGKVIVGVESPIEYVRVSKH